MGHTIIYSGSQKYFFRNIRTLRLLFAKKDFDLRMCPEIRRPFLCTSEQP
jgi:hypothetical protein